MDREKLDKYSSAITLSDMEVFVYPELMYSLLLSNIMSENLWRWRQEDSFVKLQGKSPYRKLLRLKQFIMDNFEFNLDLNTWGLTTKDAELKRFENIISPDELGSSNALFGYHGDKYYFDIDIRKHFGLDKYDGDIIPYWKTETLEAMEAFKYRKGYKKGAGECVSLAALYAAAAFVVCGIPLEDIYMVLTPLHSQNFFDLNGGVLTNNRRLVTKTMWFNGSVISEKAQRALRNEQVTIVAHNSGYAHCLFDDATIEPKAYKKLAEKLGGYLKNGLSLLSFVNFVRARPQYQQYLQFCRDCTRKAQFIKAETLFHYEHGSRFRIADETHEKLLSEVSSEDYLNHELEGRVRCDKLKAFAENNRIDLQTADGKKLLKDFLGPYIPETEQLTDELAEFLHVDPKLPGFEKNYIKGAEIKLSTEWGRQEVIDYLQSIRSQSITTDLAFYAYRDMQSCDWAPFVKAAVERNPVSIEKCRDKSIDDCYGWLEQMENESIYDGKRLAQPDEVANYNRGDGIEKAILLANVIKSRGAEKKIELTIDDDKVLLKAGGKFRFESGKGIKTEVRI